MYFDRNALIATGNAGSALWLALLQNLVSTILVFAFIPFGVAGIAFSRLARFVVWPIRLWVLRTRARIDVWRYALQLIRGLAAMIPVLAGVFALQMTPWAGSKPGIWTFALPVCVLALIVYLILLWLFAGTENLTVVRRMLGDLNAQLRRRKRK